MVESVVALLLMVNTINEDKTIGMVFPDYYYID